MIERAAYLLTQTLTGVLHLAWLTLFLAFILVISLFNRDSRQ